MNVKSIIKLIIFIFVIFFIGNKGLFAGNYHYIKKGFISINYKHLYIKDELISDYYDTTINYPFFKLGGIIFDKFYIYAGYSPYTMKLSLFSANNFSLKIRKYFLGIGSQIKLPLKNTFITSDFSLCKAKIYEKSFGEEYEQSINGYNFSLCLNYWIFKYSFLSLGCSYERLSKDIAARVIELGGFSVSLGVGFAF